MWCRSGFAAGLVTILAVPAVAEECRLDNAVYNQAGSAWSLKFSPVPVDAAVNQTAKFRLFTQGAPDGLPGGIWQPNGFTLSLGMVSDDCPEEEQGSEPCLIWMQGAYAADGDGLKIFPDDADAPAPQQVLLPGLASNLWYSMLREDNFSQDGHEGDIFTLASCDG